MTACRSSGTCKTAGSAVWALTEAVVADGPARLVSFAHSHVALWGRLLLPFTLLSAKGTPRTSSGLVSSIIKRRHECNFLTTFCNLTGNYMVNVEDYGGVISARIPETIFLAITTLNCNSLEIAVSPPRHSRADDDSVAAPQQVGSMESISPAPPQPPGSAAAAQTPSLPAFPPSCLLSTPTQTPPRVASMMTARPRSLPLPYEFKSDNSTIQCPEPWQNPHINTTHTTSNSTILLFYPPSPDVSVSFFVTKSMNPGSYSGAFPAPKHRMLHQRSSVEG